MQRRKTKRNHLAKILKGEEELIKEKEDYDSEEPADEGEHRENPSDLRQHLEISEMHMTDKTGFAAAPSKSGN